MNPLYGLMLFGVAFFGFMVVVGVVQAYRKREKAYYISAMTSFLLLLFSLVIILNQFILALILFIVFIVATPILTIVGLPKIREAMRRDLKQAQEVDPSAPLAVRDFLTWKGWFKLTYRWGTRKTMCFYSVFMMGVGGAIFFTLSIFGALSIVLAAVITILVGIVSPIFFYRQVGKALERS